MPNRYSSQKTQFFWELNEGDAAGALYRLGPGIRNVSFNEGTKEEVDATGLDDDDSFTLAGRKGSTTWAVSIPYDPLDANHEILRNTPNLNQVTRTLQCRFYQTGGSAVGQMLATTATMTKAGINVADNQALYLDLEFKLTGAVTKAAIP
jgi:hypothetical protein